MCRSFGSKYKAPTSGRRMRLDRGNDPNLLRDDIPELGLWHAAWDVAEEHLGLSMAIIMALVLLVLGNLVVPGKLRLLAPLGPLLHHGRTGTLWGWQGWQGLEWSLGRMSLRAQPLMAISIIGSVLVCQAVTEQMPKAVIEWQCPSAANDKNS